MDEDEDNFYDSLDEMPELLHQETSNEDDSTSCLFISDTAEVESCINNSNNRDSDAVSSLVPLYSGEIQINDGGWKSNKRRLKRTPKCLKLLEGCNKKEQRNSYVELFRSRIGYPSDRCGNRKVSDSARAFDGDTTNRTIEDEVRMAEVFEDAQDAAAEDSASFYENILKNPVKSSACNTLGSVTSASLATSCISELCSVSEQALLNVGSVNSRKNFKKRILTSEPVITGRLGPDIVAMKEKLENWKKRQSYGLTASQKNRIKITESKVLKELKAEMIKEKKAN